MKVNPTYREIKRRRREQVVEMVFALILFALWWPFLFGAIDFAATMNLKSLAVAGAALLGAVAIVIYLNKREMRMHSGRRNKKSINAS